MDLKQRVNNILSNLKNIGQIKKDRDAIQPTLKEVYKDVRRKELKRVRSGGETEHTRKIKSLKRQFQNDTGNSS